MIIPTSQLGKLKCRKISFLLKAVTDPDWNSSSLTSISPLVSAEYANTIQFLYNNKYFIIVLFTLA